MKGKGDSGEVGGGSEEEGEELGDEKGGGGEGGASAWMGRGRGSIGREGGWCVRKQEKGYVLHREGRGGGVRIGGTRLIKSDITRNTHPTANGVPTPITLVLIILAKKHTLNRLSVGLVRS
jgi:hypothetical protein